MGRWAGLCGSLGIGELDPGAGGWFVWVLKKGLVGRSNGVVGAVWLGRDSLAPGLPALSGPGRLKLRCFGVLGEEVLLVSSLRSWWWEQSWWRQVWLLGVVPHPLEFLHLILPAQRTIHQGGILEVLGSKVHRQLDVSLLCGVFPCARMRNGWLTAECLGLPPCSSALSLTHCSQDLGLQCLLPRNKNLQQDSGSSCQPAAEACTLWKPRVPALPCLSAFPFQASASLCHAKDWLWS